MNTRRLLSTTACAAAFLALNPNFSVKLYVPCAAFLSCTEAPRSSPAHAWQRGARPWLSDRDAPSRKYMLAVVTFLTATSASNQSWPVPGDFDPVNNFVEVVAPGGGGGTPGGGAGGGGYSKTSNIALVGGGSATYRLPVGGVHGTDAGDAWFNGTTLAGSSVGAKGGGGAPDGTGTGGAGGAAASGVGDVKKSGGTGGTIATAPVGGGGGGGAGGPNGDGAAGGGQTALTGGGGGGGADNGSAGQGASVGGQGGNGGNGPGGTGGGAGGAANNNGTSGTAGTGGGGGGAGSGTTTGGAGATGTEFDSTHGCGGGGGGGGAGIAITGGDGGGGNVYGGGGGGGGASTGGGAAGNGSSGGQALIVVTYTPLSFLGAYKPQDVPDLPPPTRRFVRGASFARSVDGINVNFPRPIAGWEVQPPQPPAPIVRSSAQRFGAVAPKEDGIEAVFVFVAQAAFAEGWRVQDPQPPYAQRFAGRYAGVLDADASDQNDQPPLMPFFNFGFEVQPPQPPTARWWQRWSGALNADAADINDQPALVPFFPLGFEQVPSPQPPNPAIAPHVRAAGTMRGDDGTQATFRNFFPLGFPVQPPQPPHPQPERRAAAIMLGDFGAHDTLRPFFPLGFPVQPWQPPHPIPEKRAAGVMVGDDGIQFTLVPPPKIIGWQMTPLPGDPPLQWPRRSIAAGIMRGLDGTELPFFYPFAGRYEPILPVVPHPRPERSGALMRGIDGTDLPFFYPFAGRYEPVLPTMPRPRWRSPDFGDQTVEFPAVVIEAGAFALDTFELPYRRRPIAAVEIEPSFLPLPAAVPWGYDHFEAVSLRRPRPSRFFAEAPLIPVLKPLIWGFERLPETPTRRRVRPALIGAELVIVPIRTAWGFEIAPAAFPRPRRAILDRGYELVTSFPPVWTSGWETSPIPQPPHPRRERAGGLMRGVDGTEARPIIPVFDGWEPVFLWPPHPRPEHAGAIMAGDLSGAWGPFVYLVPSAAVASDAAVWLAAAFDIGQAPPP